MRTYSNVGDILYVKDEEGRMTDDQLDELLDWCILHENDKNEPPPKEYLDILEELNNDS